MTYKDDVAFGNPGDHGLTKREYFAAMAMSGLMAGLDLKINGRGYMGYNDGIVARTSVEMADQLINELNKPSEYDTEGKGG